MKSAEEIMNVLEAYDLTGSYRDAAVLAGGCSHHTVAHYAALRAAGELTVGRAVRRPQLIEEFLPKLEELVERRTAGSGPMWRTASWPGWGSPGPSGPPVGRWPP